MRVSPEDFKTVVCDPPWEPSLGATWKTRFTDKARPQKHYQTMSVKEIIELEPPVGKQAHLYLWVLNQHMDWGFEVMRAWGFDLIQIFTWAKPGLGTGQFQCNSEHILVCRKGSRHGNPFGMSGGTVFNWPRGKHSEKPQEFYDLVELISPGPLFEMYARKNRPGWDGWGNEYNSGGEGFAQLRCRINENNGHTQYNERKRIEEQSISDLKGGDRP